MSFHTISCKILTFSRTTCSLVISLLSHTDKSFVSKIRLKRQICEKSMADKKIGF